MRGRPFAAVHGLGRTPAYNSWKKMMGRCYNEQNKDYGHYGGRGIRVCLRWHDPVAFVSDMGQREIGWSLERSDVNGDYSPENCRWIPLSDQAKNRRRWRHSDDGRVRLSVWAGKHLSEDHRARISTGVARARRQEGNR